MREIRHPLVELDESGNMPQNTVTIIEVSPSESLD